MGASQSSSQQKEAEAKLNQLIKDIISETAINPYGEFRNGYVIPIGTKNVFQYAFVNKVNPDLIKKLIDLFLLKMSRVGSDLATHLIDFIEEGDAESTRYLISKSPKVFDLFYNVIEKIKEGISNKKNLDTIKVIIENGQFQDSVSKDFCYTAIKHCNPDIAKNLFNSNKVSKTDTLLRGNETTPLILSILFKCLDIFKFLIESGVPAEDPQQFGTCEVSPLYMACKTGNAEMFNTLMEKNVNPNGYTKKDQELNSRCSPIIVALQQKNTDFVKKLIEKGVEVTIKYANDDNSVGDRRGKTLIYYEFSNEIAKTDNLDLYKFILERDPGAIIYNERDTLQTALESGSIELSKYIIQNLGEKSKWWSDNYMLTDNLLESAVKSGSIELVKLVMQKFPGKKLKDLRWFDYVPIIETATPEYLQFLVDNGSRIEVNQKYQGYPSVFMFYTINSSQNPNYPEIFKILLKAGGKIDQIVPSTGDTALLLAAKNRLYTVVKLLIDNGADKTIKDKQGKSISDYAEDDEELRKVVEGPNYQVAKYKGYTQDDILSKYSVYWSDPKNWSFCPVCLATTQRADGCRYMSHVCEKNARHERLYNIFQDPARRDITWCTICGRPCTNTHVPGLTHAHFKLSDPASNTLPEGIRPENVGQLNTNQLYFADTDADCIRTGGGGTMEKIRRYHGLLEKIVEVQPKADVEERKKVRNELIEAAWRSADPANSKLTDEQLQKMVTDKSFGIDISALPNPTTTAATEEQVYPDIPRPADEKGLTPIKTADHQCDVDFEKHDGTDGNPVKDTYIFQHKQKDGTIKKHSAMCADVIDDVIKAQQIDGKCRLDGEEGCDNYLYPEELKGILPNERYEFYRKKFNEALASSQPNANQGGGSNEDELFPMVDLSTATCNMGPKLRGSRRTYRRKQKRSNKTGKRRHTKS